MSHDELEAALRSPRNPELASTPPSAARIDAAVARRRRHRRTAGRAAVAAALVAVVATATVGRVVDDDASVATGPDPAHQEQVATTTTTEAPAAPAGPDQPGRADQASEAPAGGAVTPAPPGGDAPTDPATPSVPAGPPTTTEGPTPDSPPTTAAADPPDVPADRGEASAALRASPVAELADRAAAAFGDRFAGVVEVGGEPTVFVQGTEAEVPDTFEGAPVRAVRHSLADLKAAQERVVASLEELSARGVDVAYTGTDVAGNQISVGVRTLDQAVADAFDEVVGEGPYRLELAEWVATPSQAGS